MKKISICLLTLCTMFSLMVPKSEVQAVDFSKKESYYIKVCSSTKLAKKNKTVCKQFNTYLKKKNASLKKNISETKSDLEDTNDDIDSVTKKISTLNSKISSKEKEINYLLTSIKNVENDIKEKEEKMKERLYVMQTSYNSNTFVEFLFGADSLSDFFSRLNSINDITSYEKELVADLTSQKKELKKQKSTLVDAKAALQSQKNQAASLKKQLVALKKQQQQEIASNQQESKKITAAQKEINDTLTEIANAVPKNDTGGSVIKGSSGNAEVGYKVAQAAVNKIGSPYYWGATGPNYFDCSGLVYWSLKQAGVSGGRLTANGYAHSGKAISASELQAGDVIAFRRSGASTYHHIAIYIGNGIVVHASGEGSTCLGNHKSQGHMVKRSSLSSFSKYGKAYRRLY